MHTKNLNKRKAAFTIAEILVVVVVFAILFAVLISRVDFAADDSKTVGAIADIRSIQAAAHAVVLERGGFPESKVDLINALNSKLDAETKVKGVGSSIKSENLDPWDREYMIEASAYDSSIGAYTKLKIYSNGPNDEITEDDIWVLLTLIPGEGDERSDVQITTSSDGIQK